MRRVVAAMDEGRAAHSTSTHQHSNVEMSSLPQAQELHRGQLIVVEILLLLEQSLWSFPCEVLSGTLETVDLGCAPIGSNLKILDDPIAIGLDLALVLKLSILVSDVGLHVLIFVSFIFITLGDGGLQVDLFLNQLLPQLLSCVHGLFILGLSSSLIFDAILDLILQILYNHGNGGNYSLRWICIVGLVAKLCL